MILFCNLRLDIQKCVVKCLLGIYPLLLLVGSQYRVIPVGSVSQLFCFSRIFRIQEPSTTIIKT